MSTPTAETGATQYDFRFDPDKLIVGATASPTLTVTNPAQTDGSGVVTLLVLLPIGDLDSDLAETAGGLGVVAQDRSWVVRAYFSSDRPYVKLQGPALKALSSTSFEFQNLQVSLKKGTAAIVIVEGSTVSAPQTTRTIVKEEIPFEIQSFYASPVTVTEGAQTVLNWVVSGGSYVLIQPGSKRLDVTQPTGNTTVPVGAPSSNFLLQLFTDDRQFKQAVTVAFVGSVTGEISARPAGPYNTDTGITVSWKTSFATGKPTLETANSTETVDYQGSMTIPALSLLATNQTNPAAVMTLNSQGLGGPDKALLTLTFNPARIRWLRYKTTEKTSYDWGCFNASPGSPTINVKGAVIVLTLYGPGATGGPLTAYLGDDPSLQVQYLSATPNPAAPGAKVTLSYIVANATSATLATSLTGAASPVDLDVATQAGTTTFTAPQKSTTLVLRAFCDGQPTVASELDLVITATN